MPSRRFIRYAVVLLLALAFCQLTAYATRDLWCDEAITALNFLPLPYAAIYQTYPIANNHIAYTMFLKFWDQFNPGLGPYFWRFGSMVLAVAALLLLYFRHFRTLGGRWLWAAVLAGWVTSLPFALYGTAVRGYMAGFLCTVLALETGRAALAGRRSGWLGYALASLAAVAVLPSDLLALAAVVLYLAPGCGRGFWKMPKVWALAAIPVAALVLFYLPIAPQVLRVMRLKEGWSEPWRALAAVELGFVLSMLPVLVLGWSGWRRLPNRWRLLAFALPVLPIFLLHPAPFPRNFFPLWPVWLLLAGEALCRAKVDWRRWCRPGWVLPGVLLYSLLLQNLPPEPLSSWVGGARWTATGQDDWFAPYYLRADYRILPLGAELERRLTPHDQVYLSFDADPFAILCYAPDERYLLWNTAQRTLRPGSRIVLARDEAPERLTELIERFGLRQPPEPEFATSYHQIYKVK